MKAQDFKVFMRQANLEMETKSLWCLILTWADQDGSNAYPTRETLADVSGRSIEWVKKHLKILRDRGYLKIEKDRKKGARHNHNKYTCQCRGTERPPYGGTHRPTTKSLYQQSDSIAVESEAILRVLPKLEEAPEKYG